MAEAVGFVCHTRVGLGQPQVVAARQALEARGFQVWMHCAAEDEAPGVLRQYLNGTRLLVSFGGDGTLLWVAQQAAPLQVPVLGVNAGRLGFLTEVQLPDVTGAVDRWASGDFVSERRSLLDVRATGDERARLALNDVVVHKGMQFNLFRIDVEIDGQLAGRFDADGAVVSTATGSTGYALSLGGPIVHPQVASLTFLPLNPHTLFNRPVVLPQTSRIRMRLPSESGVLICDGQVSVELGPGSAVEVMAAPVAVELVRFGPSRNFFDLLRQKIHWGQPLTDRE